VSVLLLLVVVSIWTTRRVLLLIMTSCQMLHCTLKKLTQKPWVRKRMHAGKLEKWFYQRDFRGERVMIMSIGSKRAAIDASRSRREETEVGL